MLNLYIYIYIYMNPSHKKHIKEFFQDGEKIKD